MWVERKQRRGADGRYTPYGKGTWKNKTTGEIYIGEYRGLKKHGHGVSTYPSVGRYEGAFREGKKHGQGVLMMLNGDTWVGTWVDDKRGHEGTRDCAICLGSLNERLNGEPVRLSKCGHMFHADCILQWREEVKTCPLCRGEITLRDNEGVSTSIVCDES
jgi:hypothetical protein